MKKVQVIAIAAVLILIVAGIALALNRENSDDNNDFVTVTQSDGTEKTVPHLPDKVVCLSTYACELLMIYGCTDKVVGVTNSSYTNTDQAKYYGNGKSTDVGNFNNPSIDTIVNLEPDLVITWSTQPEVAQSLENAGLTYIFLQCSSINSMMTEATSLGKIMGTEEMATKYCNFFNHIVNNIDDLVAKHTDRPSVYLESFSSYSAAGSSSTYYQMAVRAGADMVYTGTSSTTISAGWLIEKNPQIIIKTPMLYKMVNGGSETIYNEIIDRVGFNQIAAVENSNVYVLCSQLFGGPRCFAGMIACYEIMFPDELDYTMNTVLKDYNETFGLDLSISSLAYPVFT